MTPARRMFDILFSLLRQLYTSTRDGLLLYKLDLRAVFYWIYVRNFVSLRPDSNRAPSVSSKVQALSQTGFQVLPRLSHELTQALTSLYLESVDPRTPYENLHSYFDSMRNEGVVRPEGLDVPLERELMKQLFNETGLLELVSDYLGLNPEALMFQARIDTLIRISTERTFVNGYDDALEFHRDVDSLKFVKAFCYLNHIEEGCGHHEVLLGTHREIPLALRFIRRYTEEELRGKGIAGSLKKVTGLAGYGFIENTTAFHRGTVPTDGDRLILSMSFNDMPSTTAIYRGEHYVPLVDVIKPVD